MGIFDMFRKKKEVSNPSTEVPQPANEDMKASAANPAHTVDSDQVLAAMAGDNVNETSELPEPATMLLGFGLLNSTTYSAEQIIANMQDEWNIRVEGLEAEENMVFELAGMNVAIAYIPGPIPNQEVEANCRYNVLWPEAEQVVSTHQSHVIITVMGITDPIVGHALFTQIVSSVLKLDNAIGYYAPPMVVSAQSYLESAQMLKDQELPVQLWVFLGLYTSEQGGSSAYTVGMKHFGKDELEIVNSQQEIGDVFEFMINIISYAITSNVTFRHGETIGFSEDHKLSLTRSPAVAMEGDSIKIGY